MSVLDIIKEPLEANFPDMSKDEMEYKAIEIAAKVGLNTSYLKDIHMHFLVGNVRE